MKITFDPQFITKGYALSALLILALGTIFAVNSLFTGKDNTIAMVSTFIVFSWMLVMGHIDWHTEQEKKQKQEPPQHEP